MPIKYTLNFSSLFLPNSSINNSICQQISKILSLGSSCGECPFASLRRYSDIESLHLLAFLSIRIFSCSATRMLIPTFLFLKKIILSKMGLQGQSPFQRKRCGEVATQSLCSLHYKTQSFVYFHVFSV